MITKKSKVVVLSALLSGLITGVAQARDNPCDLGATCLLEADSNIHLNVSSADAPSSSPVGQYECAFVTQNANAQSSGTMDAYGTFHFASTGGQLFWQANHDGIWVTINGQFVPPEGSPASSAPLVGQIGFHNDTAEPTLVTCYPAVNISPPSRAAGNADANSCVENCLNNK